MDKRSYLRTLGFTVGERGRFSAEMLAALATAPAGAVDADAPKAAPKPRAVKPVSLAKPAPKPTVSQQVAARPSPLLMPKVRPEGTGFTTIKGILIRQSECGTCRIAVTRCTCKTGPRAYKWLEQEAGGPLALVLDKPASLASV